MDVFDQILLAALLVFSFGVYSLVQGAARALLTWTDSQNKQRESSKVEIRDHGTQTTLVGIGHELRDDKMWTSNHGTKCHLFKDCPHVKNKSLTCWDGLCTLCMDRDRKMRSTA